MTAGRSISRVRSIGRVPMDAWGRSLLGRAGLGCRLALPNAPRSPLWMTDTDPRWWAGFLAASMS